MLHFDQFMTFIFERSTAFEQSKAMSCVIIEKIFYITAFARLL